MQSVSSNGVAKSLSYSTSEQLTGGKWIDGKPIYRRVFETRATTRTQVKIQANIKSFLGCDKIIKLYVVANSNNGAVNLPYYWGDDDGYRVYITANDNLLLGFRANWQDVPLTCYTIIEYTKS